MKLHKIWRAILALALLLSILSVYWLNESQETEKSANRFYPAISSQYIVWEEETADGDIDIYGCTWNKESGTPGKPFPIIEGEDDQLCPAVYDDTLIWMEKKVDDNRSNYGIYWMIYAMIKKGRCYNWDIYLYDISEGKYQFSNASTEERAPLVRDEYDQCFPAISEKYVVWQDSRNGNWDIYGYDLETEKEFRITTNEADQQSPAIYEDIVVWEDYRNGNGDIYGYNILTAQEFQITADSYSQQFPAIYIDDTAEGENSTTENSKIITVVWMEWRDPSWDIYGYKLSEGNSTNSERNSTTENSEGQSKVFPIIKNENDQRSPAISEKYIVFYDDRYGYYDIFVYNHSTNKESPIKEESLKKEERRYPAIYGDYVVWMYKKDSIKKAPSMDIYHCNCGIYFYDISKEKGQSIREPEYVKSSLLDRYSPYFASAGIAAVAILLILLLYRTAKKYTKKIFEYKPKSKIHGVNACKDPISNYLLGRWDVFFIILSLFFLALVLTSLLYGTLVEIDINSLPREKVVLLKEEAGNRPIFEDPEFFFIFLIPIAILYPAIRFFRYIPRVFEELLDDKIITKKKKSETEVLSMLNTSLKEYEKKINEKHMYVCGSFLGFVAFLRYFDNILDPSRGFVGWDNFFFFPVSSIMHAVIQVSIYFTFGIFVWKMCCVVSFMWKLNRNYDLVLKLYDVDGSGGFGPLEELWLRMSYMAIPVLAIPILLFFLHQSFGTPFNPASTSALVSVFVIGLLVVPAWNYHNIIETGKSNYLERIEENIEVYQKQIEEGLSDTKKDLDDHCLKEIGELEDIIADVKSIHSLPFKKYQKAYLTLSVILPWIPKLISYIT